MTEGVAEVDAPEVAVNVEPSQDNAGAPGTGDTDIQPASQETNMRDTATPQENGEDVAIKAEVADFDEADSSAQAAEQEATSEHNEKESEGALSPKSKKEKKEKKHKKDKKDKKDKKSKEKRKRAKDSDDDDDEEVRPAKRPRTKADVSSPKKKGDNMPNKPKGPQTAYFMFMGQKRQEIKDANPTMKIGDLAKELGRQWGLIDDSEKAIYKEMAEEDKQRFASEMAEYTKTREYKEGMQQKAAAKAASPKKRSSGARSAPSTPAATPSKGTPRKSGGFQSEAADLETRRRERAEEARVHKVTKVRPLPANEYLASFDINKIPVLCDRNKVQQYLDRLERMRANPSQKLIEPLVRKMEASLVKKLKKLMEQIGTEPVGHSADVEIVGVNYNPSASGEQKKRIKLMSKLRTPDMSPSQTSAQGRRSLAWSQASADVPRLSSAGVDDLTATPATGRRSIHSQSATPHMQSLLDAAAETDSTIRTGRADGVQNSSPAFTLAMCMDDENISESFLDASMTQDFSEPHTELVAS